jgi:phosphatidyl-myo-inositol dimannoside synthase
VNKKKVLFYYLSAFSNTGGIEKFNRCFIKALNDIAKDGDIDPTIVSVYDKEGDERYTNKFFFKGFNKDRGSSVRYILKHCFNNDILIIGHINLSIAALLVKLIRPKCKVFVIGHGIEVWERMFFVKKWTLQLATTILSVSNYTKNQLVLRNNIDPGKIRLFPNTIDPYFNLPKQFVKPAYLLSRYNLTDDQPVIVTLSRLVSSEKYKGYDKVIAALGYVKEVFPTIKYILAGKYDDKEKERVDALIRQYKMTDHVILTGYLSENEVTDHYCLADLFIMPSRKEGFGIVFLEALASGVQVIGGNQDGTVDALLNGALGKLINPAKISEISDSIVEVLSKPAVNSAALQAKVLEHYRFERYKERLQTYINEIA